MGETTMSARRGSAVGHCGSRRERRVVAEGAKCGEYGRQSLEERRCSWWKEMETGGRQTVKAAVLKHDGGEEEVLVVGDCNAPAVSLASSAR